VGEEPAPELDAVFGRASAGLEFAQHGFGAVDKAFLKVRLQSHSDRITDISEGPSRADTVEKLPKCIAAKNRPNDILNENPCSMPPPCGYGRRSPLQRQLRPPPKSLLDSQAYDSANFGLSPKIEFFNGIRQKRTQFGAAAVYRSAVSGIPRAKATSATKAAAPNVRNAALYPK
jgi:hypothetical protein